MGPWSCSASANAKHGGDYGSVDKNMIQLSQYPLNENGSDMRNLTHFIDEHFN